LLTEICAGQWFWQNPLPQGNNLSDICEDVNHPGRFFAVGDHGTILKKENLSDWQIIEQGNFDHLFSVYFKGNYGWAVGYNGTILQNIDGLGNTWYPLSSGTTKQLLSVFFFDQLNGWIVGQDKTVLHTTDGGTHWNSSYPTGSEQYFSVYFTSLLNGWIAGAANTNGVIKKTTDGGTTWTNSLIPTNRMNSIKFIDENIGCAVGDAGKIFFTSNGGTNWNSGSNSSTSDLKDVYLENDGEGWAVGYDGTIIYTSDYGNTWSAQTSPTTEIIYGIEKDRAVGWAGIILHRETAWQFESSGFTDDVRGLDFGDDGIRGLAVGENGKILYTSDAGNSWTSDNSGTNYDFYDIDVISGALGWTPRALIVGEHGTVLSGQYGYWVDKTISTTDKLFAVYRFVSGKAWVAGEWGRIWKTTNMGDSWALKHENTSYHLYAINFVTANLGWAAGMSGTILKTTDGGESWFDVSPNNHNFFRSIYFVNNFLGWVVGNDGAIFKTTDGGYTWVQIITQPTYPRLNNIKFLNVDIGWITGATGTILFTSDGGETWSPQNSGSIADLMSLCFTETGIGWAAGFDGAIIHTENGGGEIDFDEFWRRDLSLPIPDPGQIQDILEVNINPDFLNDYTLTGLTVVIDTIYHTAVSDLILLLTHAGITDTLINRVNISGSDILGCKLSDASSIPLEEGEAPFAGIFKPYNPLSVFSGMNPNGEWILTVIDAVTGNSGTLESWGLKLFLDVPTEIESHELFVPVACELFQNYPNPFNPSTTISWQSPVSTWQTLKVYDVLGNEVATLVDEYKPAGKYEVEFSAIGGSATGGNAYNLPSGVYFYQLRAGEFIETKKMILLK